MQRDAALEVVFGSADPLSVVLLFAAGTDPAELSERLAARRSRIEGQLAAMAAERERLTGQGMLPPLAVAAFRRGELRLDAELRWHEEFGRQLAAGVAGMAGRRAAVRAVGGASGERRDRAGGGAQMTERAVGRR